MPVTCITSPIHVLQVPSQASLMFLISGSFSVICKCGLSVSSHLICYNFLLFLELVPVNHTPVLLKISTLQVLQELYASCVLCLSAPILKARFCCMFHSKKCHVIHIELLLNVSGILINKSFPNQWACVTIPSCLVVPVVVWRDIVGYILQLYFTKLKEFAWKFCT